MQALRIYAGPAAREHIARQGLRPADVAVIPAAAGGPKGLILGPLDRFIFGPWLSQSAQPIGLVGASIGAWRMASACMPSGVQALAQLEHDYIAQDYEIEPGQKRPTARHISERFAQNLQHFYADQVQALLQHPRYRLHIIAARGRHVLARERSTARTALGYLGAYVSNGLHRKALGAWLERVVFSAPEPASGQLPVLPFATQDYRTRQVALTAQNFHLALRASCSIPFALQAVHDIPGAPPGAYWDGGLTDYHLHLHYRKGLVLYPHFQQAVVPGWLDKHLRWRHRATGFLASTVVLAPDPAWVARCLPRGKLPDRSDFIHYGSDALSRRRVWTQAVQESQRMADEFAAWCELAPEQQASAVSAL